MTAPPLTGRRWLAGLLELLGDLIQQLGYLLAHVGDGLEHVADRVDPDPTPQHSSEHVDPARAGWTCVIIGDHIHHIPTRDAITHDRDDDCPCGPTARCQQTGAGDVWHITHHRLTDLEETP